MRLIYGSFLSIPRTFRNFTTSDEDYSMVLSETTRRSNRAVFLQGKSGARSYLISNDRAFTKFTGYFPTINYGFNLLLWRQELLGNNGTDSF